MQMKGRAWQVLARAKALFTTVPHTTPNSALPLWLDSPLCLSASSVQELVYKQGQAGVTRASVTVVFSNRDKKGSPVGYESYDEISVCRQVAIGGRNKYLINGHVAQQNKVQNLFHSVQLNVNNPHFLIMQGRITKVINMAPMEILGLIAEAAGTKMYESKKDAALKTIEKKQAKVEEIQKILDEDISPTLEKLRKERAAYMAWSTGNVEKERLERFCTGMCVCVCVAAGWPVACMRSSPENEV